MLVWNFQFKNRLVLAGERQHNQAIYNQKALKSVFLWILSDIFVKYEGVFLERQEIFFFICEKSQKLKLLTIN